MPSPYLLQVNSRPISCSNETWEKFYIEEHIPDLVEGKISTRAALYREVFDVPDLYAYNPAENPRNYLTIYQTESKELLMNENLQAVQRKSTVFPNDDFHEKGEFDVRNYELIHDYDPSGLGDTPAPYILYAELEPEDEVELDTFYREEHFPMLNKVPGYRRGLRYKLGPDTPLMIEAKPTKFVALHEFDAKHGIKDSEEMKAVTTTPWTLKIMKGVKAAEIRSFELIEAFGY